MRFAVEGFENPEGDFGMTMEEDGDDDDDNAVRMKDDAGDERDDRIRNHIKDIININMNNLYGDETGPYTPPLEEGPRTPEEEPPPSPQQQQRVASSVRMTIESSKKLKPSANNLLSPTATEQLSPTTMMTTTTATTTSIPSSTKHFFPVHSHDGRELDTNLVDDLLFLANAEGNPDGSIRLSPSSSETIPATQMLSLLISSPIGDAFRSSSSTPERRSSGGGGRRGRRGRGGGAQTRVSFSGVGHNDGDDAIIVDGGGGLDGGIGDGGDGSGGRSALVHSRSLDSKWGRRGEAAATGHALVRNGSTPSRGKWRRAKRILMNSGQLLFLLLLLFLCSYIFTIICHQTFNRLFICQPNDVCNDIDIIT